MYNNKSRYTGGLSPEFALLGFLAEKPGYGYELHQRLEAELGCVWHLSQSQSYNILKRLETQGYVNSTRIEQEKLPSRQMLTITTFGRERFETWLQTPTGSSVRAVRLEFITRLFFIHRREAQKIQAILDKQTIEVKKNLTRLEQTLENTPREQTFNRLSLELRVEQMKSLLEWLSTCYTTFA